MKKFKRVAVLLAIVFGVGIFASCEFSTIGMEKPEPNDVKADWVSGKWVGTYEVTIFNTDGSIAAQDKKSDYEFDCSSRIKCNSGVALLVGLANTGDLYSDPARLKIVYSKYVRDTNGKIVSLTKVNLKKKV